MKQRPPKKEMNSSLGYADYNEGRQAMIDFNPDEVEIHRILYAAHTQFLATHHHGEALEYMAKAVSRRLGNEV